MLKGKMFESKHYVPGIKWRQGEYLALSELNDAQRDLMTPLVDIPPIPWNFEDEQPAKSIDQHLTKVPAQMADYWGTEHPLFVDLALLDADERMANGRHPVDDLFARLSAAGVEAIPVTGTDRDANYQAAVRTVLARDDQGVALRLTPEDFGNVTAAIAALIAATNAQIDQIDQIGLIFDFGAIQEAQVQLTTLLALNAIQSVQNLADYRTVTLGAFPVNLSEIAPGLTTQWKQFFMGQQFH
jgi:Beta protein